MGLDIRKPEDIIRKVKKVDFMELLQLAHKYDSSLDVGSLLFDYSNGHTELHQVYKDWEKSVDAGAPDFSLYGRAIYMNEAFNCWKLYSRRYLILLRSYLNRPDSVIDADSIRSVLDLGCGCGYTTVGLSSIFPNAHIYGTNLKDTLQYKIAENICKDFPQCTICDESHNADLPESPDVVFASEFFEHLESPIVLLDDIIAKYHPKCFVFANTFTQMSLGHFAQYYHGGIAFPGKTISRVFNDSLRAKGYVKVNAGFFNNRPNIYVLPETGPTKNRPLFEG